jgi:NAD(P)-dependent dehydrogenase (short-subunit alcohol dehydrogenase family)
VSSAVVTGAGAGIGRAIAGRLARDGWLVVGLELDHELVAAGMDGVELIQGDVADRDALERALAAAQQRAPLAGWVNNAADTSRGNLHDPDFGQIERQLLVNVAGVVSACSIAVRAFIRQAAPGAIVNISSIHGRRGAADHAAYDTSKGAIDALTRHIATAYGPYGIRANAIAPGAVRTPALERALAESADPGAAARNLELRAPLRRLGEPDEIAAVAAFLLSAEASYLTGQSIAVDGGWTSALVPPAVDPELADRYDVK